MSTAVIVIGVVLVLLLIWTLAMGNKMVIERSVEINKSSKEIFEYLKLQKNQNDFSIWNMKDPEMKKSYKGNDGEKGFIYTWDSAKNKNVGAGEQEITFIHPYEKIQFELRFKRPMENTANAEFRIEPLSSDKTKVIWGFYGPTKFPMSLFKIIFQNMLGKDLADSLQNLKRIMES